MSSLNQFLWSKSVCQPSHSSVHLPRSTLLHLLVVVLLREFGACRSSSRTPLIGLVSNQWVTVDVRCSFWDPCSPGEVVQFLISHSFLVFPFIAWSLLNSHPPLLSTHHAVIVACCRFFAHHPEIGVCGSAPTLLSSVGFVFYTQPDTVGSVYCPGLVVSRLLTTVSLFVISSFPLAPISDCSSLLPFPLFVVQALERYSITLFGGERCSGIHYIPHIHAERAESMEKCVDYCDSLWSSLTGIPTQCVQSHLLFAYLRCLFSFITSLSSLLISTM